MEEIQEVYLSLEERDSLFDNELIVIWAFPHGVQRDKTYRVRKFKHQYEAVRKLAEFLSEDDDDFLSQLEEADMRETEDTPNKKRWVSEDRSELTDHEVHEIDGFHLKLKHDKIQQRKFARIMCDVAGAEFLQERPQL